MKAQVKEWGNSQGIRIPKEILEDAGISLNEVLDISVTCIGGKQRFLSFFRGNYWLSGLQELCGRTTAYLY